MRPVARKSSRGAGAKPRRIVCVAASRSPTWTTASWLRYSAAPNHQALPGRGAPRGGRVLLAVEGRRLARGPVVGRGQALEGVVADEDGRRAREGVRPAAVTTLMAAAAERPCSAEKRFVAIWNSCTASWGRFASGPPTASSLLSCPSIVMLPPRPSWPAEETARLFVFVGSKLGAGAFPGTRKASSRKFRPFRGRFSTTPDVTTPPPASCRWRRARRAPPR